MQVLDRRQRLIDKQLIVDRRTETGFKKYLVDIILAGRISQAEHAWLAAILPEKDLLTPSHQVLLDCLFEDIQLGLIELNADSPTPSRSGRGREG